MMKQVDGLVNQDGIPSRSWKQMRGICDGPQSFIITCNGAGTTAIYVHNLIPQIRISFGVRPVKRWGSTTRLIGWQYPTGVFTSVTSPSSNPSKAVSEPAHDLGSPAGQLPTSLQKVSLPLITMNTFFSSSAAPMIR